MRRRDQNGFTLIEAVTLIVVIGGMSVLLIQSLKSLTTAQRYSEGQAVTLSIGERVVHRMVRDLEFALRVFTKSPSANELVGKMELDDLKPIAGSELPAARDRGYFEPDPYGQVETGNTLLVAASRPSEDFQVTSDSSTIDVRVDTLQFVLYFLTEANDETLDLHRWASQPVARYRDIVNHEDSDVRSQIVSELYDRGVVYAWALGQPTSSAFYKLTSLGQLVPVGQLERLNADPDSVQRFILTSRQMRVARNGSSTSVAVPAYGNERADYPHGFEIKLDGSGAGQLVLLRLVIRTQERAGRTPNCAEILRLVSVRQS